jgi:hypothetical protein
MLILWFGVNQIEQRQKCDFFKDFIDDKICCNNLLINLIKNC